jgi:hypothetical protein
VAVRVDPEIDPSEAFQLKVGLERIAVRDVDAWAPPERDPGHEGQFLGREGQGSERQGEHGDLLPTP